MLDLRRVLSYCLLVSQMTCLFGAGYFYASNHWLAALLVAAALAFTIWLIRNLRKRMISGIRDSHLRRELEHRYEQRTIELEKANRLLEDANQQLRVLSIIDPLTQMYNRRGFEEHFLHDWRLNARRRSPLAILMIDIDFFKHYNDSLGHVAGDACLQSVAAFLKSALRRPTDIVARYGGEEFVALLSDTNNANALAIAESLRNGLEAKSISHPDSAISGVVTISIGVASCVPDMTTDALRLIELADQALYQAKHQGRNRVAEALGCPF